MNPTVRLPLALLCFAGSLWAQGVVTTVAGTGWIIPKLTMPGAEAPLGLVRSMAIGRDGSPLVLDSLNHILFRVSPDGVFTSVAGNGLAGRAGDGGLATRAALDFPSAMTADTAGNIYIADSSGTRIRKVDTNGIITTIAGGGTREVGDGVLGLEVRFQEVNNMAALPGGDILLVDENTRRIFRIDAGGTLRLFAGNGNTACGTGLDGPALEAALCDPRDLVVDPAGVLYFIDTVSPESFGGVVRRVGADGVVSTFAGSGAFGRPSTGATAAESPLEPIALGLDRAGRLMIASGFVAVDLAHRTDLVRIEDGRITLIPAKAIDELIATALTTLSDGTIAIATFQPTRISRLRADGTVEHFAGTGRFGFGGDGGPAALAQLNSPAGVTVDSSGNLFIADSANGRIRRMNRQGRIETVAGNGQFVLSVNTGDINATPAVTSPLLLPIGIVAAPDGLLYYFSAFGVHVLGSDGIQYSAAYVTSAPGGLALDAQGRLLMADTAGQIAFRVGSEGAALLAGEYGVARSTGDGGLASNASLSNPVGIVATPDGSIYIGEGGGNRVRRIAPNGFISTFAGTGASTTVMPGTRARASETPIDAPSGLAVDGAGNLLVRSNGYISRITPAGELSVIAGVGPKGVIYGDGGLATQAALSAVGGIAVDRDGSIYFTEADHNRVRKILASPPSFQANPALLEFTGASGGAAPRPKTVTVLGGVPSLGFMVRLRTTSGGNWLSASSADAVTPHLLQITVNPASLAPGSYSGTIELDAALGAPRLLSVAVRFVVGAALPPELQIDQSALSFTYPRTARRRSQLLVLTNAGSGAITYEAVASSGSFVALTPARGTVTAGTPLALRVEAEPGTRRSGAYRETVTVRWSGGTKTVSVVMTISDREQAILLSQAGLSFQAVAQGGVVPPQSFRVLNTGNGSMAWRATASTLAGGPAWLRVSPASGVSDAAAQSSPAVEVAIAQKDLAPGVYYGLVQVESTGAANTPHVLTVSLEVLPAGSRPGSLVQPRELTFQVLEGQSPSSDELTVYNLTASPQSYRSSTRPLGANQQIQYGPIDASVAPNDPQRIVVQPDTASLPPGKHRGSIALQFDDGTVRQVDVNVVVAPRGLSTTSKLDPRRGAEGCSPTLLVPSIRSIGQAATVAAGWPTAVVAELRDDCGRTVDDGAVTISFSNGDAPVPLQSVKDGLWHGTWSPKAGATGAVTIRVQAEERVSNLRGEREIAADLRPGQDPPEVQAAGIVNTPSPAAIAPLAPGGLITVNGSRITVNQTLTAPPRQNLPARLQDTEIIVAGRRLPLFAASADRAQAMLPFDLAPNTSHQVLVRRGLTYSKPVAIDVAAAQPAVLLNPQAAATQALAEVRRPGESAVLNTAANPARPGDTVAIFCSGLGAVTGALEAGQLTPGGSAIRPSTAIRVKIGGVDATVLQTSLVEGEIGRYQIVLTIPASVTAGDRVSVEIEAEGLTSAPATLVIGAR